MSVDFSEQLGAQSSPARSGLASMAARWYVVCQHFPRAVQGLLSIFDQAIVSGTSFVTAAIIGRTTSPGELGLYYLLLSIVVVVSGVQDQLVLSPYVVYSKRRTGRELAEYAGSIWVHQFVLLALTAVGLLVAIAVSVAAGEANVLPALWTLVIAGPLLMLRDNIRRFSFANLHVTSAIVLDSVLCLLQFGGLAALAYLDWLTLWSIYAVMGASCALACLAWLILDRPRAAFVRNRVIADWRHNWSFGKWALRSFLVGNTTGPALLWVLGIWVGAAATGLLGACMTIIGLTNVIMSGVSNVLTPQAAHAFATGGTVDLRRVLIRAARFFVLTLGAFTLFVFATGDWLAVLIFGPAYAGSGPILLALAATALMNSLGMVAGNGLWAIDQPRCNFVADVCCMITTLVTAAVFIVSLGALGAAIATLAGTAVAATVRTITLIRLITSDGLVSDSSST
jgi:O-antigen/teichoic acid export membrane protein